MRLTMTNTLNTAAFIWSLSDHVTYKLFANNMRLFLWGSKQCLVDPFNLIVTGKFTQPVVKFLSTTKKLNTIIRTFVFFWRRVAFRGKSFRVRNFRPLQKVILNLGFSHWTRFFLDTAWTFLKKRRQSYVWFTQSFFSYTKMLQFVPFIRTYNCYTMRGFRFKKQPIVRRFGKISQHISSLH